MINHDWTITKEFDYLLNRDTYYCKNCGAVCLVSGEEEYLNLLNNKGCNKINESEWEMYHIFVEKNNETFLWTSTNNLLDAIRKCSSIDNSFNAKSINIVDAIGNDKELDICMLID